MFKESLDNLLRKQGIDPSSEEANIIHAHFPQALIVSPSNLEYIRTMVNDPNYDSSTPPYQSETKPEVRGNDCPKIKLGYIDH